MDQFHFSRVFKRVYGVSPSTFQAKRDTGGEPSPVVLQGVA
jgi:AraC-like DNA-binding protein